VCIGRRARTNAVIAPKIARVHARCTVIANRADDATRPFFCSVAAAKVGAGARSENRQNATQPENSSVAAARKIVTAIGTFSKVCATKRAGTTKMPSGEGAALHGVRPRCILRHTAPACPRRGRVMPCAACASVQVVGEMGSQARQSDDSILKNTSFGWSWRGYSGNPAGNNLLAW